MPAPYPGHEALQKQLLLEGLRPQAVCKGERASARAGLARPPSPPSPSPAHGDSLQAAPPAQPCIPRAWFLPWQRVGMVFRCLLPASGAGQGPSTVTPRSASFRASLLPRRCKDAVWRSTWPALLSKGTRETREATCPPASPGQLQCLWPPSGMGGAPRGWQDHVLQQGGFCLPIPAGSRGLCAGREPTHTAVLPAARSREPLVALQELLPAGRSLTRLQGQPPLASAQAPGEQPGALSKTESPLATPQILRLPVKGCSSPRSPQGLLPSLLATGAAGDETQARLGDSQGEQRMPARCWLHAWPRRPSSPLLRAAPLSL